MLTKRDYLLVSQFHQNIYINSSFIHQNFLVLYVIQVQIFLGRHTITGEIYVQLIRYYTSKHNLHLLHNVKFCIYEPHRYIQYIK